MLEQNNENIDTSSRATCQENFDVVLPPQALKWDGQTPYIIHKRKVYRAKQLKNGMLEVKASQSKWTVKIA